MQYFRILILLCLSCPSLMMTSCGGGDGAACELSNLSIVSGDCTCIDGYSLSLDFEVVNPSSDFFEVQVRNGVSIGYFKLTDLPITIPHFQTSGLLEDFIKVCVSDRPDCCEEIEFISNKKLIKVWDVDKCLKKLKLDKHPEYNKVDVS